MALILSINEEKDSLALTERLLTAEGHWVVSFEKVQQALSWLSDHQPDLVLAFGGRFGEKARKQVDLLKQAGLAGEKIVLLIGRRSLHPIQLNFNSEVQQVIAEIPDNEDFLKSIDIGLGRLSPIHQSKSTHESIYE